MQQSNSELFDLVVWTDPFGCTGFHPNLLFVRLLFIQSVYTLDGQLGDRVWLDVKTPSFVIVSLSKHFLLLRTVI